MDNIYSNVFLLVFVALLGSVLVSVLVNKLLLRFSANLGVKDHSNSDVKRWVSQTKPTLGGISFYAVFIIATSVFTVLQFNSADVVSPQILGLLSACTIGFLLGLADDSLQLSPLLKFSGQVVCANILYFSGFSIYIMNVPELNYIFTILWVIAIMNSVNMLDNMDGITGTISLFIIMACIIISGVIEPVANFYTYMQIAIIGSIAGFLFYNWHPAKIYMGDSGSQFLGIFLSAMSILFLWVHRDPALPQAFQLRQFALPLVVFTLPIIDTLTVTIRRIARGQSPFIGGRDHTTHHLAFLGLKDYWVTYTFALVSVAALLLAVYLSYQVNDWSPIYSIIAFAFFFILFCVMQWVYYLNGKKKKPSSKIVEPDFQPKMKAIKD